MKVKKTAVLEYIGYLRIHLELSTEDIIQQVARLDGSNSPFMKKARDEALKKLRQEMYEKEVHEDEEDDEDDNSESSNSEESDGKYINIYI